MRCWLLSISIRIRYAPFLELEDTLISIALANCPGEDIPVEVSDERAYSMHKRSTELTRLLRDRGVGIVKAEYRGIDGRGGFDSLQFTTTDGANFCVFDGVRNPQVKAMFRAMLLARHPDWCRGAGSHGDFRRDIGRDSVTHRHWARAHERQRRIDNRQLRSLGT